MVDLPSRDPAMVWIIERQLGPGNLSDDQMAIIEQNSLQLEAKIAAPELRLRS
jgi:hypothetical protein